MPNNKQCDEQQNNHRLKFSLPVHAAARFSEKSRGLRKKEDGIVEKNVRVMCRDVWQDVSV
jgi:hypothetical protein